jgi:hypothetical protein
MPTSKIEAAYHRADKSIQQVIELMTASKRDVPLD